MVCHSGCQPGREHYAHRIRIDARRSDDHSREQASDVLRALREDGLALRGHADRVGDGVRVALPAVTDSSSLAWRRGSGRC